MVERQATYSAQNMILRNPSAISRAVEEDKLSYFKTSHGVSRAIRFTLRVVFSKSLNKFLFGKPFFASLVCKGSESFHEKYASFLPHFDWLFLSRDEWPRRKSLDFLKYYKMVKRVLHAVEGKYLFV